VPVREGWRGTFPIPGWLRRYDWRGFYPKDRLPAASNPARGWLATANSDIVAAARFPIPYNNDVSAPARFLRIAARIESAPPGGHTLESSAAIQTDDRYGFWPRVRRAMERSVCGPRERAQAAGLERARRLLCEWDGRAEPDSVGATIFELWTNAVLDRALSDEVPGGPRGEPWRYVQSLLQFEADVHWLWLQPENAPVWDDARTPEREERREILERALRRAVAEGCQRYGPVVENWWGRVRPFALRHPFAAGGGLLGLLWNSPYLAVPGDTETVFKQQHLRSDRERMRPAVGPVVRLTVDFGDPWSAVYSLAGGESGWPLSAHYADRLAEWAAGINRRLTPPSDPDDIEARLAPP